MKLFYTTLVFCLLSLYAAIAHAQPDFHSVHQDHSAPFQHLGDLTEQQYDLLLRQEPRALRSTSACSLKSKVYGWHPYWQGTSYTAYDFSLLSTFSYFSYEVNPATGSYNSIHSWKTTPSVTAAQAAGCRVELCATLFGSTGLTTFLSNATAKQTFIDSIISLVQFRNADGVNIDFEGMGASHRAPFTAFMQTLSTQLKAAIPGASLTMALYSVDWGNCFDIPALDPYVDEMIIMGYGYYYSGSSTAGPNDPLYVGPTWAPYSLTRSVLYYLSQGITPSKLLVGLPYYGNEYTTAAGTIPSAANSFISSRTYNYMRGNYNGVHTRNWDAESLSSMWSFQVGGFWRQGWVDDADALSERFDMVRHKGIGGIGIWALGYDNGYTTLWDLIEEKFSDCGTPVCTDTLYDSGGPLGNYRNSENYNVTIQSPNGQRVQARFLSFNLEASWDFCYVYDGPTTASPLLGTYSGTTLPAAFNSTGNALTFRFTSDNATVASGYSLKWDCVGPPIYPDTIRLSHNDSALIDCGKPYHVFLDSDAGAGATYLDNENNKMTFCVTDPSKVVKLNFEMLTSPVQLDLRSTTSGNDYLHIWDGPTVNAPLKGVYTGSTSSYPQPGTIISSGQCLTVRFQSDANTVGGGWKGTLRCANPATVQANSQASSALPGNFTDTGGAANYSNNEHFVKTWCPTGAALAAGQGIWAQIGAVELEQNYDYLHVFDGPDRNGRLIASFTGNDLHQNDLQTIKATTTNPGGCLTFEFFSDGGVTKAGWNATMTAGALRRTYGADACSSATLINASGLPFAGSTTLATGKPNAEDPPLNIQLISLPQCSGPNAITRLENTVWYRFSTPSTICPNAQIDLTLTNIACQNSIPGGNGAQFMLYDAGTCQTGAGWGSPIYCSDKLLANAPINIASLLQPSHTYYVLIDGFAGQHCNLDLMLTGDINGCILPIELLSFAGEWQGDAALLRWETDAESNNQGFWLQRSTLPGNGFEDIAWLDARAQEGQGATYVSLDAGARRSEPNYYRLRQLDLDGHSHFHKVLRLAQPGLAGALGLVLFPNPSTGLLNLELDQALASDSKLRLMDLTGKTLVERPIVAGTVSVGLDVAAFAKGIYLYELRTSAGSVSGKWIKE
jgi:spore germination protein YaaH